jgi:hypothetical protein
MAFHTVIIPTVFTLKVRLFPGCFICITGYMCSNLILFYCFLFGPALPTIPVHEHREFVHGTYDYSSHLYGSVLNATYGGYVQNAVGYGAPRQPIMYPSY